MAHKTLIDGTSYSIVGGTTLVDGTSCKIVSGRTLIDGTGYDVPFKQEPKILLTKFVSFPPPYKITHNGSTSNDSFSSTGNGVSVITAIDCGIEDFKDVESMHANVYSYISGSLLNQYYWKFSQSTGNHYVNPYPTESLTTIGWCNQDRTESVSDYYVGLTSDNDGGLSLYSRHSDTYTRGNPYWSRVKTDYYGNDAYTEIDGLLVSNAIKDFQFNQQMISWSDIEVDKKSKFTVTPYNLYALQITYDKDGVEYSYWYSPKSSDSGGNAYPYSDITLLTYVPEGEELIFNTSRFYLTGSYDIKKVRAVYLP